MKAAMLKMSEKEICKERSSMAVTLNGVNIQWKKQETLRESFGLRLLGTPSRWKNKVV
jgi:hypothetical protein